MFSIIGTEDWDQMIDSTHKSSNQTIKSIEKSSNDSAIGSNSKTFDHKKYEIRSYLESLPSIKSTVSQQLNKNSETVDKKPTFLMTKSRCVIKLLNSDNKSNNSHKSSASNNVILKLLSPLKRKEFNNSAKVGDSLTRSQPQSPQKMRLWIPKTRFSSVYKLVPLTQTNQLPLKAESDEPKDDLICDDEYFKYLGLIDSKKLCSQQSDCLNVWPLRTIACVKPSPKRNTNGDIILMDICQNPNQTLTQTDSSLNTSETNSEVSRRKLAKHQWLNEVRDKTQRLVQQKQIERLSDENSRKRDKELRQSKKEALHLISSFDISSYMGKRIFRSLFQELNNLDKYLLIINSENHCFNDLLKYMNQSSLYGNNSKNSTNTISRITRSRDGMDWNPRHYQHKYCFNRSQRLEKWKRIDTGLDWRSRLIKSHCKTIYIKMKKIINCPLCSQVIGSKHQCYDCDEGISDCSDSSQEVCVQQKQSNNSVILIDNDFNENQLKLEDHFNGKEDFDESSGNSEDDCQEDDDVIFIEEIIKPKNNVLKVKQMLVQNKPVISSSDSTQMMPYVKMRSLQTCDDLSTHSDKDSDNSLNRNICQN